MSSQKIFSSAPKAVALNEAAWADWRSHAEKHVRFYKTVKPFGRVWKNEDGTNLKTADPNVYHPLVFQDLVAEKEFDSVWMPWFQRRPWKEGEEFKEEAWNARQQGKLAFARQMAHLVSGLERNQIRATRGRPSASRSAIEEMISTIRVFGKSIHREWQREAKDWPTPYLDHEEGHVVWVPLGVYQPEWNEDELNGLEVSTLFFTGHPGSVKGRGNIHPMTPYALFSGERENERLHTLNWSEELKSVKAAWLDRMGVEKQLFSSAQWTDVPSHSVDRFESLFSSHSPHLQEMDTLEKASADVSKDMLPTSWWSRFDSTQESTLRFGKSMTFDFQMSVNDMHLSSFWSGCLNFETSSGDPRPKMVFDAIHRGEAIEKKNIGVWKEALSRQGKSTQHFSETGLQMMNQLQAEIERIELTEHVKKKLGVAQKVRSAAL